MFMKILLNGCYGGFSVSMDAMYDIPKLRNRVDKHRSDPDTFMDWDWDKNLRFDEDLIKLYE